MLLIVSLPFIILHIGTRADISLPREPSSVGTPGYSLPFEEAAAFYDDFVSQAKFIYKLYCQQGCQGEKTFSNRFCQRCYCDSACNYYGDCCPDYDFIDNSKLVSHKCLPTQVPFPDKFFRIVESCPDDFENDEMVKKCNYTFAEDWKSVQPVSDSDTGLTYKNRYCAECNGVLATRVVRWAIGAKCDAGPPELSVFDSKKQVYISLISTEDCNIVFVKPDNITYRPCSIDNYKQPRMCNTSGYLRIEDPLVEQACLTFQENIVRFYPNVFCYICNTYYTWDEIKRSILGHDPNVFRIALSALLDLDDTDYYDDGQVNSAVSCAFLDPYTCQCRNVSCAEGKKFEDGKCVSVFKLTNAYRYNLCFHGKLQFNENSSHEAFLDKFVQTTGSFEATIDSLIFDINYLSECGPNVTLTFTLKCTIFFRNPVKIDVFEEEMLLMPKNKLNLTDNYLEIEMFLTGVCKTIPGPLYLNNDLTVPCSDYQTNDITISQFNLTVDRHFKLKTTALYLTNTFSCPKIILQNDEVSSSNDSLLILTSNKRVEIFERVSDEEAGYLVCLDDYLDSQHDKLNCDTEPLNASVLPKYSTLGIISGVCTCISVVFLIITLVIFGCFKSLRTTIGIGIIALTASLIIAQLLFEFGAEQTEFVWVCQTLGILTHFCWLASTFWMNVCTMILFYKLNFPVKSRNISTKMLLIASNLYCWGSSGLIITTVVLSSYFTDSSYGYGGTSCYITSINGRRYGFALPVGVLVLINILLFSSTFIKLKLNEKLQSNQESQISMLGCLKLSVITGLTWIFAFVFEATGNTVFAYLFTLFVGSQGVVIFLAFVGNKRVLGLIKSKLKTTSKHTIQSKKESSDVGKRTNSINLKYNPENEDFEKKKKLQNDDKHS